MKRAVYAGSFDPIHAGHIDIIRRGAALFDEVVVGVAHNPNKRRTLALDVRLALIRDAVREVPNVRVETIEGLTVAHARGAAADVILRGIRDTADFAFEAQIGQANRAMVPQVETLLILSDPALSFVSSSLIKEIMLAGGDVRPWLTTGAFDALRAALSGAGS